MPPPRERVMVNGTKPLEAPSEETTVFGDASVSESGSDTAKEATAETPNGRVDDIPGVEAGDRSGDAATGQPPTTQQRVDELEERLDRLSVICEAMWHLLSGEVGLSLDQLAAKIDERAVEQARLEEPPEPPAPESICPDCGETMPIAAKTCLFCSARPNGTTLV